jgi:microcystin-dependent protein
MIMPFAGTVPPDKWELCHGQELTRGGSYEQLYEVIGNLYGTPSDPATKFKVPDFRGRFLIGHLGDATTGNRVLNDASADTVGLPGGSESGVIQQNQLPDHQHSLQGDNGEQYYSTTGVAGGTDTGAQAQSIMGTTAGTANTQTGNMIDVDNDPFYHTPPFVTVEYIIYTGVSLL